MDWFSDLWSGQSISSSILILSVVISIGVALGKVQVKGVSLGVTWTLFIGILFAHFGIHVEANILNLFKDFGLILFIYTVGMLVGPSFFSSFKKDGIRLNLFALIIALLGCVVTYIIYLITDTPIETMMGVMSGAVTNTPGLGVAQQTSLDITGVENPDIAAGYAVAYPSAIIGTIITLLFFYSIFRIKKQDEEKAALEANKQENPARLLSLSVENKSLDGLSVYEIQKLINRNFIISRIKYSDGRINIADANTQLHLGDIIFVVTSEDSASCLIAFIGKEIEVNWDQIDNTYISQEIVVTKSTVNGSTLSELHLRDLGVNITRIYRAGITLVASPSLQLQMGDKVVVVGTQHSVNEVSKRLGNSLKKLNLPNLFQIFIGIAIGIILGSIPLIFPGIPQPVKLGLAGGPLIIAILISRFGPKYKIVTYTTESATLMLREIGIALFLASVGLSVGGSFIDSIVNGGYKWIGYGLLITVIPLLIMGFVVRKIYKMNYFTMCGLMAGAMTDAPALAIVNEMSESGIHSVSYATVYPLTMFMRVLLTQLMLLLII
ncbi:YidE/YbjL duplication [Bacteroides coprosuis DSM 18011]|uniref:YidE/YbjL duplication n=1 Tax=Bacteroides coprosuis DSM 18011 TaxID=679937 RepID=F3ZU75_9BACE|nr:putative transporter [Bacteroides coprosuis]EGJ71320.1 YidE/YbjL duplication [Bacteroides coprosuis DSM 18011]